MSTRIKSAGLQIGAVAEQTSVNIETIRYYERQGLLPLPSRSAGGRRLYDVLAVQRLSFIRRSRELGFSLVDTRELLRLADDQRTDCRKVRTLAVHHLDDIRGKIASLEKLERALATLTDACRPESDGACPILAALSTSNERIREPARQ